jgi:GMP synthase (glutamine-hydrolysing)
LKTVLIVKMGTTLSSLAERRGDFDDWVKAPLELDPDRIRVVKPYEGEELPDPRLLSGVVITGSHDMITDRNIWSELTAAWLPVVFEAGTPLLGICYGHQLIAHAMGGHVGLNPRGVEFGTVEIRLNDQAALDPLFRDFAPALQFQACHSQSVITLPPEATLLASNFRDSHQAFSIGETAWGVQFHPEFDADIVATYVKECSDVLNADGIDPAGLLETIENTPHGEALLRRFGKIIEEKEN